MTLFTDKPVKWPRQLAWQRRNPDKRRAHRAVHQALRSGKLVRLPCEECGRPDSEAHHPDYTQPLIVVWLCRPHHRRRHRPKLVKVKKPAKPSNAGLRDA